MPPPKMTAVEISEPALLIRVARLYKSSLGDAELYDITRGVWKLGERRKQARYAMAVYRGEVKEVYEIEQWHRGHTTPHGSQPLDPVRWRDRWEFTGQPAVGAIRDKYIGRSVANYFTRGNQNPVTYVNC